MKIIIHGDDYGRSKGITDNMSDCIDKGCLRSVSIPANGHGFDYSVEEFKKRNVVRASVHLDLVEWKPVSDPDKLTELVDENGFYKNSFIGLWLKYLFANKKGKEVLFDQVRKELDAQISKVRDSFADVSGFEVNIDSHQHFHMIPFVFDAVLSLAQKHNISYVRLGHEPFFLHFQGKNWTKNYFGSNLIKHFLLKILSIRYKEKLKNRNINYADYFIGLFFTGSMSVGSVRRALSQIKDKDATVEILFHSCKAVSGEEEFWEENDFLLDYYYSEMRDYEKEALLSEDLVKVIEEYK